jgi:hypothetical protein
MDTVEKELDSKIFNVSESVSKKHHGPVVQAKKDEGPSIDEIIDQR